MDIPGCSVGIVIYENCHKTKYVRKQSLIKISDLNTDEYIFWRFELVKSLHQKLIQSVFIMNKNGGYFVARTFRRMDISPSEH